jgi:hypothetical protein
MKQIKKIQKTRKINQTRSTEAASYATLNPPSKANSKAAGGQRLHPDRTLVLTSNISSSSVVRAQQFHQVVSPPAHVSAAPHSVDSVGPGAAQNPLLPVAGAEPIRLRG